MLTQKKMLICECGSPVIGQSHQTNSVTQIELSDGLPAAYLYRLESPSRLARPVSIARELVACFRGGAVDWGGGGGGVGGWDVFSFGSF